MSEIRSAVILAAGMSTRLRDVFNGQPKGFLPLGGQPIIERSIQLLLSDGIEKIIIVTGYLSSHYEALASTYEGVHTVYNPLYAESGSMYSLYCAREHLDAPFLLLESDLIYEQRALQTLLTTPKENAILVSGFTNAGDEIYIGTNGYPQRISGLSKKRHQLTNIIGELVGISKISPPLWKAMVEYSEAYFRHDLRLDYEEGTLHGIADTTEIFFCKVDDLLWAEIDEASHWQRAKEIIWPQIQSKERESLATHL